MEINRYYYVDTALDPAYGNSVSEYIKCHIIEKPKKRTFLFDSLRNGRVVQLPVCLYDVWARAQFTPMEEGRVRIKGYEFAGIRFGFLKNIDDDRVWTVDRLSHVGNYKFVCLGDARSYAYFKTLESLAENAIYGFWNSRFFPGSNPIFGRESLDFTESANDWYCTQLTEPEIQKLQQPFKTRRLREIIEERK